MSKSPDTRKKFKTRWYHRHPKYWFRKDKPRTPGHRAAPEIVRFEVEPGVEPSGKPPVRIFLGSEPMQARAERVFLWSVKAVRDPARVYEIHLMKDLVGYDRDGWTTGFTNYRYAIPMLGGLEGRGIYNDVDQIYVADPSALFDAEMADKAILCIDQSDTSVSVMDCARLGRHWDVADAKKGLKRKHFLDILVERELWGPMGPEWNARDLEYTPGQSKCFHFTTLRTQPWKPFADQMRYDDHPFGDVWFALEKAADAARFNGFTRAAPGSRFAAAMAANANGAPSRAGAESLHAGEIGRLAAATSAGSTIDVSAPTADGGVRAWGAVAVTAGHMPFAEPVVGRHDGAASIDGLSAMPEEDVPWALDELFAAGGRFVYVAVAFDALRADGRTTPLPPEWWRLQMTLAAARTPGRQWTLIGTERGRRTFRARSDTPAQAAAA